MNTQKALEIITNAIQTDKMTVEQDKALAIAQKALEKQIPKKPLYIFKSDIDCITEGQCPLCKGKILEPCGRRNRVLANMAYCPDCGQKLDWESETK